MNQTKPDRGVIFDLDGTLADTLDDLVDALNATFTELGYAPVEADRLRMMIGDGLPLLLQRAADTDDPEALARILDRYRGIYRDTMLNKTKLYPGIAPLLDRLKEHGVPLTVLSNKSHEFTEQMCAALLADWPFQQVKGMTEEALKKPNPTVALRLAEHMACPPDRVFFIGDSSVDVDTGRRAGMKTIGVTWGFGDRVQLREADPDHLADHPRTVGDLILAAPP